MTTSNNTRDLKMAARSRAAVVAAALTATSGVAVSVSAQTSRPSREPAPAVEVEGSGEGSGEVADGVEERPVEAAPLYGVMNTLGGGNGGLRTAP